MKICLKETNKSTRKNKKKKTKKKRKNFLWRESVIECLINSSYFFFANIFCLSFLFAVGRY